MPLFSVISGSDAKAMFSALNKSQAVIEFDLQGNILTANENFCRTLGYELSEIAGKHHRIFCDPDYVASTAYKDFWAKLGKGLSSTPANTAASAKAAGTSGFRRPTIPCSPTSKPYKIVKFATEVTAAKLDSANAIGKIEADLPGTGRHRVYSCPARF